mmetsp:Transcript_22535/g.70593  ORF Transcript_22535/g.70593 Transcript_22535/m.70593 type:complete len:250 (-) Transcript_22535:147-896(-)
MTVIRRSLVHPPRSRVRHRRWLPLSRPADNCPRGSVHCASHVGRIPHRCTLRPRRRTSGRSRHPCIGQTTCRFACSPRRCMRPRPRAPAGSRPPGSLPRQLLSGCNTHQRTWLGSTASACTLRPGTCSPPTTRWSGSPECPLRPATPRSPHSTGRREWCQCSSWRMSGSAQGASDSGRSWARAWDSRPRGRRGHLLEPGRRLRGERPRPRVGCFLPETPGMTAAPRLHLRLGVASKTAPSRPGTRPPGR